MAIDRFQRAIDRSPRLVERVFTPAERELQTQSLAARWAAKEALAKALGAPGGLNWQHTEIRRGADGRPGIVVTGTVAARVELMGITNLHLSLSHDAGIASAVVVAEGER